MLIRRAHQMMKHLLKSSVIVASFMTFGVAHSQENLGDKMLSGDEIQSLFSNKTVYGRVVENIYFAEDGQIEWQSKGKNGKGYWYTAGNSGCLFYEGILQRELCFFVWQDGNKIKQVLDNAYVIDLNPGDWGNGKKFK